MSLCPVCGFRMKYDAEDFRICPSCGTEFGYDDSGVSHAALRERWRLSGLKWWSPVEAQPTGWDPYLQLIGIYGQPRFSAVNDSAFLGAAASLAATGQVEFEQGSSGAPSSRLRAALS